MLPPDRRKLGWPLIILLLGSTFYLYLNLFVFPRTPFLLGGDQVYFWMDAQRMLHGERVYQDFFQFTPPGTDLFYLAWFKLLGPHIWVTNLAVLVLGVALCWICFSLARDIMDSRSALLATSLFLVLIFTKLLNGTHHWLSLLAVMCAVKVCSRTTAPAWILLVGALLGVASFFTQTRGAFSVLAFAVFLACSRLRRGIHWLKLLRDLGLLFFGYISILLLLSAHFIAAIGWERFWYFQVTYVRQYLVRPVASEFLGLPEPLAWHSLPKLSQYLWVFLLLPVIYPVAFWRLWRERRNPTFPWRRIALLSLVGFALLLEVAFTPNWLRVFAASMPGIILLVWVIDRLPKIRRYALAIMWAGTICIAVLQTGSRYMRPRVIAQLPGGAAATSPVAYEKLHWITQHTLPGQFFFQAGWPGIYLPLELRNPVYVDAILPGDRTRPEDIASAIQQLEAKRVQFVLWTERLALPDEVLGPSGENVTPLRNYLYRQYTQVQVFSDGDTVWRRNDSRAASR